MPEPVTKTKTDDPYRERSNLERTDPSVILLPPVVALETPKPQTHSTVYRSAVDYERVEKENAERRFEELKAIVAKHKFVELDEFMKLEKNTRLGASGFNALIEPNTKEKASNFDYLKLKETGVVVVVNGIPVIGCKAVKDYCETTVGVYGKPVMLVVNNQEGLVDGKHKPLPIANIGLSVENSIAGLRNAEWGAAREPSVMKTANLVCDLVNAGIPVTLVLHSQGTIIGSNAMTLIKRSSTEGAWDRITEMVKVDAYAPAQLRYPKGLTVNFREHTNDPIVFLGEVANIVKQNPLNPKVKESDLEIPKKGTSVAMPGWAHDYDSHTDKIHKYFIREVVGGVYTKDNGINLAYRFNESVKNAEFSDKVHDDVLSILKTLWDYKEKDRRGNFSYPCRELVQAFRDKLDTLAPTGKIGEFVILKKHQEFFSLGDFARR